MDITRMRGYHKEAVVRAQAVVDGSNSFERNGYVLSIAADIYLSDALRAKKLSQKHNILSERQMRRRKRREIYLEGGSVEYNPRTSGGRRSVRMRHSDTATAEDLGF